MSASKEAFPDRIHQMDNVKFASEIQRGDTLRDNAELDQAIRVYKTCIAAQPNNHLGHYKLGTALMRLGEGELAEASFRNSLALAPDHSESANNLALMLTGRGEYGEAEAIYRNVLADKPDFPEANLNLGDILYVTRRLAEAVFYYRRSLAIRPNWPIALMQLGQVLIDMGRSEDALTPSEDATSLDPGLANAWTNLGRCLLNVGEPEIARSKFEQSISIDPAILASWHNWLLASNYLPLSQELVFANHCRFGDYMSLTYPQTLPTQYSNSPNPARKLRLGLVTGDLRRHSVSYFLEGVLRNIDPKQFEVWVYYTYHGDDYRSAEFKTLVHKWQPVFGITDQALTKLVSDNLIDVLFDLSGHTGHGRLAVFASKPAPIQISWVGYPNTTGLKSVDYRLTDNVVDPVGSSEEFCTEQLLRLPDCFLCYTPPSEAPEVAPTPSESTGQIAFGSFNAISKISNQTLSLWAKVLAAVPGSKLVLKAANAFNSPERSARLLERMKKHGIAPERVQLLPWERDISDHLSLYGLVDIALDTVPYNGTTTTCEALWMGVPVVTLEGDRHASRVGSSLLQAAGLGDLVSRSEIEYVEICAKLSADARRLGSIRSTMRETLLRSRLLDANSMTHDLQVILRNAWSHWCEGRQSGSNPDIVTTEHAPGDSTLGTAQRLHLGGKVRKEGWKILNIQPGPDVDFVGDVRDLSAFPDSSFEEVYASHVLEHVRQAEFQQTLNGIQRILAPGGRLYISVPDMDTLCREFLKPELDLSQRFHLMRILFGGQIDDFDFHYIGLNLDFMVQFLQRAGFYSVEQVESFGIFDDDSLVAPHGTAISLNLIAVK